MKKLMILILALFASAGVAQQTNPQTNFPATVRAANPSLYLNFNDLTTSFKEQISGKDFAPSFGGPSTSGSFPATLNATGGNPRIYMMTPQFTGSGVVSALSVQFYTTPTAGAQYPILVATANGSGSYTITAEPGSITVAATTAVQTFTSGSGLPVFSVTAGQTIGLVIPSGYTGIGDSLTGTVNYYDLTTATIPAIGTPTTYTAGVSTYQLAISATVNSASVSSAGTTTTRQPGFDATQTDNTSAAFSYNAWNAAPSTTLGAIDWDVPFSVLVHVDRLNWNRTGSLVLMSKGDIGSTSNNYWELYLQMSGGDSQLCFTANGLNSGGASFANISTCTSSIDAMPNGFNYDIVVTNNGSGYTSAFSMYINGLEVGPYIPGGGSSGASQYGFGRVSATVSGGTGYANSTAITNNGTGGANCVVNATMTASSGVPSGISYTQSSGCTSTPTLSLVSPTGTGAVLTPTLYTSSMNSTTYPLLAPGYVSGGAFYGVAGTDSAAASTYVDEAAIFPGVLTATQIEAMYYQTKFYQTLLGARPAVPPAVVFDDDGCGDMDDLWALQEAIALHKLGYINLEGDIQEDNDTGNAAFSRQQLDQAGLANVPVGIPSDATVSSACNTTALNTFNAATLGLTNYPTASQVYRQVFAANAGAPVSIVIGGELSGLANFMQSPADSVSPLTGAQMFARNAANGGVLYSQGGGCTASSAPASTPCTGNIGAQFGNAAAYADAAYVYANGTAMPMTAVAGTPLSAGPGPLATRTGKDPAYLQMSLLYGTDVRTAYDSLPMSALVTPYFNGGVNVGYSGGTGYAASTLFTSTGGGANCSVTGYMTASGGVPNGVTTLWGEALPIKDTAGVVAGLGWGCTSAPTLTLVSPAGTGVTLTAYPTTVCVASGFPGYPAQSSASGACNNQYQAAMSQWAVPSGAAPVYTWFLNSLVDTPPRGAPKLK